MSRKKTKSQTKINPLFDQVKHKKDYLLRIKKVCENLVGPGWFEIIPAAERDIIYKKRYPSLTIKLAPGVIIDTARFQTYKNRYLHYWKRRPLM
jgi:hypothetical protein